MRIEIDGDDGKRYRLHHSPDGLGGTRLEELEGEVRWVRVFVWAMIVIALVAVMGFFLVVGGVALVSEGHSL